MAMPIQSKERICLLNDCVVIVSISIATCASSFIVSSHHKSIGLTHVSHPTLFTTPKDFRKVVEKLSLFISLTIDILLGKTICVIYPIYVDCMITNTRSSQLYLSV